MNTDSVLKRNLADLNMAHNLASIYNNEDLKNYVNKRINNINKNYNLYSYLSINNAVDSYAIDLQLFIRISDITHDLDSKDFYKSRLIDLFKNFDYLKSKEDLSSLI